MKKNEKNSSQIAQNYVNILGIKVLSTTKTHLLTSIRENISHNNKFSILTPNPELVLASDKDEQLRTVLNKADFSVPDGVGLKYASIFLFGKSINIIPGRKLFIELIALANKKGWKVFFLGGMDNEAEEAAEKLGLNYKSVRIRTFAGPNLDKNGTPITDTDRKLQKEAIGLINRFSPHMLFVAFGNPKQELWIEKNLKGLNVNSVMAVGGTLRFIAGKSRLPPKWMEKMGFEWLWRLILEPYRLGRIFKATFIFPLRILWFKVSGS